jgi:hypothetical protein
MLTLPEDLVILAVGAKPRGGPDNGKLPWQLSNGIRGAVLVALALAGRVEVTGGTIVVRDPAPLGDPDLDQALTEMRRAYPMWNADPMRHATDQAVHASGPSTRARITPCTRPCTPRSPPRASPHTTIPAAVAVIRLRTITDASSACFAQGRSTAHTFEI